ncbi:holocytochrome c synthase [Tulasnella sp. 427]|nr:holocytochrome c synthase [Tulasnella sp. 427]
MGQASSQPQAQAVQIPASHPPMGDHYHHHTQHASSSSGSPPPGCPMHQKAAEPAAPAPAAKCPVKHDAPSASSGLNPHNNMPSDLTHMPSPGQTMALPTERVVSSIPRPAEDSEVSTGKWEYPSPQQFYNALVRKGWETPEEHVETMVEIHNFLNEEAWNEVLKWEKRWSGSEEAPELARLHGKPGELSPKARMHMSLAWLFPSKFHDEPPFDRHDWIIRRPSTGEEVRYVIDYYSAPDNPDGSPVFSLDVRPALDSVGSVTQRISVATEEAWKSFRASESRSS